MRRSYGMTFAMSLGVLCIGLEMISGCSDSVSSDATMIGVAIQAGPPGWNGVVMGDASDQITQLNVTRARVVLGKIEVRGTDDTVVFRSDENTPMILNLDLSGRLQVLSLVPVEHGEYSSALIRIERLEAEDSTVWKAHPDVQNHSLVVEGFLNGDPGQPFVFSTGLDEEAGREFEPVMIQDKGSTVIVFQFDYTQWFRDDLGNLINPDNGQLAAWRSVIEDNIVSSLSVH